MVDAVLAALVILEQTFAQLGHLALTATIEATRYAGA